MIYVPDQSHRRGSISGPLTCCNILSIILQWFLSINRRIFAKDVISIVDLNENDLLILELSEHNF